MFGNDHCQVYNNVSLYDHLSTVDGIYMYMYEHCNFTPTALLQHHADASIRNTDGKTALDLAEPLAAQVLSGEYKKSELLQAARYSSSVCH